MKLVILVFSLFIFAQANELYINGVLDDIGTNLYDNPQNLPQYLKYDSVYFDCTDGTDSYSIIIYDIMKYISKVVDTPSWTIDLNEHDNKDADEDNENEINANFIVDMLMNAAYKDNINYVIIRGFNENYWRTVPQILYKLIQLRNLQGIQLVSKHFSQRDASKAAQYAASSGFKGKVLLSN